MDDLISRQATIDAMQCVTDSICAQQAIDALSTLPSAERRGRWIKDKNLYKCTACNDLLSVAGWADCIPEKQIYTAFKYCPNCGAKMDEVSEDE